MSGVTGSSSHDPGAKLTYDDLVDMPDDGLRREIIDGELFVTPSPSIRHQTKTRLYVLRLLVLRLRARITHTSARESHARPL